MARSRASRPMVSISSSSSALRAGSRPITSSPGDICEVEDAAQQPFRHPHGPARTATGAGEETWLFAVLTEGSVLAAGLEEWFGPGPAPDMSVAGATGWRVAADSERQGDCSREVNGQDVPNRDGQRCSGRLPGWSVTSPNLCRRAER